MAPKSIRSRTKGDTLLMLCYILVFRDYILQRIRDSEPVFVALKPIMHEYFESERNECFEITERAPVCVRFLAYVLVMDIFTTWCTNLFVVVGVLNQRLMTHALERCAKECLDRILFPMFCVVRGSLIGDRRYDKACNDGTFYFSRFPNRFVFWGSVFCFHSHTKLVNTPVPLLCWAASLF